MGPVVVDYSIPRWPCFYTIRARASALHVLRSIGFREMSMSLVDDEELRVVQLENDVRQASSQTNHDSLKKTTFTLSLVFVDQVYMKLHVDTDC